MLEYITKEKIIACVAAVAVAGTIVASEVARTRSYGSTTPTCNPFKVCSKFELAQKLESIKGMGTAREVGKYAGAVGAGILVHLAAIAVHLPGSVEYAAVPLAVNIAYGHLSRALA